jgi:hypothetical protein
MSIPSSLTKRFSTKVWIVIGDGVNTRTIDDISVSCQDFPGQSMTPMFGYTKNVTKGLTRLRGETGGSFLILYLPPKVKTKKYIDINVVPVKRVRDSAPMLVFKVWLRTKHVYCSQKSHYDGGALVQSMIRLAVYFIVW